MKNRKALFFITFIVTTFLIFKARDFENLQSVVTSSKEKTSKKKRDEVVVIKSSNSQDKNSEIRIPAEDKKFQEITQRALKEFLEVQVPTDLPEDRAKRYKIIYDAYLKASFFLNEVAGGNLRIDREKLSKAFRIISVYIKEVQDEGDDIPLEIIKEDYPEVFAEALSELLEEERSVIETLITPN